MSKTFQLCLLLFCLANFGLADAPRRVEENVLISESLPAIRIRLSKNFRFIGTFPFRIQNIAAGERFMFVDGDTKNISRMFIAQFESFLPENPEIYHYSFDKAIPIGGFRFRQNTFAFSFAKDIKENPQAESAFTQDFLHKKNYTISDEWMSSRFLTLGDESRRSEMILFYMEPIASTGHRLGQFFNGESPTAIWQHISKQLDQRSRAAFDVLPVAGEK